MRDVDIEITGQFDTKKRFMSAYHRHRDNDLFGTGREKKTVATSDVAACVAAVLRGVVDHVCG